MAKVRKQTVSLCMIVRNEERNLRDCLEPIASLFDEIVIVDTGSQDATKQIAGRFTPHVLDFPWCDDFSAARNESLKRARGDWVFWLDADDRVRSENVGRLHNLLDGLEDSLRVYYMDTLLHGQYECEGAHVLSHPRLFRRHPELHWRNRVHEQLRPDMTQLGYETAWSDIQIDHLGYQNVALRQRKLQRDLRLLRMDYATDPTNCSTLFHLALAYSELRNHPEARKLLGRMQAADDGTKDCMARVYRVLAELSLREGDTEGTLRILAEGLARFPRRDGLLYMQANVLFELGRYEETRISLEQIMDGPDTREHHAVPCDIKRKLAPRKLADVFRLKKQFDLAERVLQRVIQDFPSDTHAWYALGCVYGDTSQEASLHAVIERLRNCPNGEIFADMLLAAWHMQQRELEPAGILINRLIGSSPEVPLPRVLLCQWLEMMGAPLEARMRACRDVLKVQPANAQARMTLSMLENSRLALTAPVISECCTSAQVNGDYFSAICVG